MTVFSVLLSRLRPCFHTPGVLSRFKLIGLVPVFGAFWDSAPERVGREVQIVKEDNWCQFILH